jgi:hypothetical protein
MINVIPTSGGTFNLIGGNEHEFTLQGNLTVTELQELVEKATAALANHEASRFMDRMRSVPLGEFQSAMREELANDPPAGTSPPLTEDEIISETWLLEHLPSGWTYDCTMKPEMAFLIGLGVGTEFVVEPFLLPCRLLKNVGD